MTKLRAPDLWHLEKALTAIAMVVCIGVIFGIFLAVGENLGWLPASVAAAVMLALSIWAVIRFIPLSEYRVRR